ncbi:MAG: DNA-processing protein DprA [Alphaproteobacteria bacterium]
MAVPPRRPDLFDPEPEAAPPAPPDRPGAPASGLPLDDTERLARLRLIRSENVGPTTFEALIARYGSAKKALAVLPDLARRGGRTRPIRIPPPDAIEREMAAAARAGARFIVLGEPAFPRRLAALSPPPPVLCVMGSDDALHSPSIAIVGARNASALGRQFAERLARDLGAAGVHIVSGLARGIDGAAHRGALDTGTSAVLAGGLDCVYPPDHKDLAAAVARSGALVSEMPLGTAPQASLFPRRNRLVAGLALGVVVVEAALRSGSLITAHHAAEQGREVMAVPGFPLDPRGRGCNQLLRQGATLIEDAQDVMEAIGPTMDGFRRPDRAAATRLRDPAPAPSPLGSQGGSPPDDTLEAARRALWPLLGASPTPVDALIQAAGVPTDLALTVLMEWDLAGRIHREPGGAVSACEPVT